MDPDEWTNTLTSPEIVHFSQLEEGTWVLRSAFPSDQFFPAPFL